MLMQGAPYFSSAEMFTSEPMLTLPVIAYEPGALMEPQLFIELESCTCDRSGGMFAPLHCMKPQPVLLKHRFDTAMLLPLKPLPMLQ